MPATIPVQIPGVYPRVCGGTNRLLGYDGSGNGLSPRVRGNLAACPCATMTGGSIPACAGEPLYRNISQWAK